MNNNVYKKNGIILNQEQRLCVQKYALKALCEFDELCKKNEINYTLAYGTLIGAIRHKGFIPWDDDIDVCVSRKDLLKLRNIANRELSKGFFYQSHNTDCNWYRLYDKIRIDGTIFREIAHENEAVHQGVYIDIFALDYVSEFKTIAWLQSIIYNIVSAILSAKYLSIRQRKGGKKYIAWILKYSFYPIKKVWLYNIAETLAMFFKSGKILKNFESSYRETLSKSQFEKFINVKFENQSFKAIEDYDSWLRIIYGDYMQLPPLEKRVTCHVLSEIKL